MNYEQAQHAGREQEKELAQFFASTFHARAENTLRGGPLPCTDSSDPKEQTTVLYTSGFIVTGLNPDFSVARRAFKEHWENKGWHEVKTSIGDRHVKMASPDNFTVRLSARPQAGEAGYEVRSPCVPNPDLASD